MKKLFMKKPPHNPLPPALSVTEEARRSGVSRQRIYARRKNALGLCSRCPLSKPRPADRAGLCEKHYADHVRRSRERMRRLGGFKAREETGDGE